jgi:hypothetical protein
MAASIVELEVQYITQTEQAVLIDYDNEEYWIPQSQIDPDSEVFVGCDLDRGDQAMLICTRWIAQKTGMTDQ